MMKRSAVFVCPRCKKVKLLGQWVEMPIALEYEIDRQEVEDIKVLCPDCVVDDCFRKTA